MFVEKSRTVVGKFSAVSTKLHSTCQATFWWKAAFASEILISNFFWHLAQTLKVLAKLLPAQLYKLLSTCLNWKKLWVQIFEQKLWCWKFLQIFMIWRIHSKTSSGFSTNFSQCCQSCIQGVQTNNLWKNLTWEKSFEIDKVRGCLLKNLEQLSESFRQFRKNCILTVESRFYREIFIVRTMLFGKIFRILGEKMSSYLRNCFCKSVWTAFYVNKRKAFLSILMRNFCFPKCLYYLKICRIQSKMFPVFLHWIFWQVCQSCI